MKLLTLIFLPVIFLLSVHPALAQTFPKPQGHVNDFANLYSQQFRQSLEQELTAFEQQTTAEIAVVTAEDLQGTTVEDYAVRLFENWKIGKENKDNGVLLLIAKTEREVRIEVGYGLEPVITDSRAGRIIREQIVPQFRNNNYEGGTRDGVTMLEKYVRGESVPEETPSEPEGAPGWVDYFDFLPFLFFGVVYVGSFMARSKSIVAGGVLGGVLGLGLGLFIGSLFAVVLAGAVLGGLGLILDYFLSRNYQRLRQQHKPTDWWHSGGGFFGGGRSGGGGGFGGFGGGSSGGGGASGRW